MRVDILGLEAFVAIADLGGFQRAAGHLGVTQTAVTRRLQKLEGAMGVQLLVRSPRRLTLTRAGSELLPQVRKLITDLGTAVDETRLRETGHAPVVIGCLVRLLVPVAVLIIAIAAVKYVLINTDLTGVEDGLVLAAVLVVAVIALFGSASHWTT